MDEPKPKPEEHTLPAEVYKELRPLQLQFTELRRQTKEAELIMNASARMAMILLNINPDNGYSLVEDGTKFIRRQKESTDA